MRAGPVEFQPEADAAGPYGIGAVADRQRMDLLATITADEEEPRALRRAEPLVAVAGVVRRPERPEVERKHAGRVRTVDDGVDAPRGELADEALDREHEPGRARDVVQQREPRPRRDVSEHGVDDLIGRVQRKRDRRHDDARARTLGDEVERIAARVVGVVRRQELVARGEPQRTHHGIDAAGRVRHERDVLRVRADEVRQLLPCRIESLLELAGEESDPLRLHLGPKPRLLGEHLGRTGAELAVVQEGDIGIEPPQVFPSRHAPIIPDRARGLVRGSSVR